LTAFDSLLTLLRGSTGHSSSFLCASQISSRLICSGTAGRVTAQPHFWE